ncbi:MAG TPA: hypothetical protein PK727_04560 [Bacteroidales bacterium]|nr:hypothetical protein [Bacteroidales bacterium]HOG56580.1 hypothetical protein [Bacteroidales bacterium]
MKRANIIIVSNDFEIMENARQLTEKLFELGYGVQNTDLSTGIISTTAKPFKNGEIKLNILVRDNKILIRGDFTTNISVHIGSVTSEQSWAVIENRGQKNSPYYNAWNEMNKLALLLPGEKSYEIK